METSIAWLAYQAGSAKQRHSRGRERGSGKAAQAAAAAWWSGGHVSLGGQHSPLGVTGAVASFAAPVVSKASN
jgi:hypothetical protein